jgi:hypothetical protein
MIITLMTVVKKKPEAFRRGNQFDVSTQLDRGAGT